MEATDPYPRINTREQQKFRRQTEILQLQIGPVFCLGDFSTAPDTLEALSP